MIQNSPLLKAYQLIKRNRSRRKLDMYKLAFGVLVDRTTAVYLPILIAYLFASFFILGDFTKSYDKQFIMIEEIAKTRFWLIATILPVRYIAQSFGKPGVIFSSTEYQLSLLPYERKKIWLLCALEKWMKQLIIYTVIGLLIAFILPISYGLVFKYIALLLLLNILMTIPQWKLYQVSFWRKLSWLFFIIILNAIHFYIMIPLVSIGLIGVLVLMNLQLQQTMFRKVNWDKVTEVSDYQLWTMWIVSKASEIEIKHQKKYSVFQKITHRKKPFKYEGKKIYHRLWFLYFGKNYELLLQGIGAMLVLLTVFRFINDFLFHLGIAAVIYMYTSILMSFFKDQFQTTMIEVLPWDLLNYERAYFRWSLYGGLVLLIPVVVYVGINATILMPFQLLFICGTFLFTYNVKMNQTITILEKKITTDSLWEGISYVLLLGVVMSWKYPLLNVIGTIACGLLMKSSINLRKNTIQ